MQKQFTIHSQSEADTEAFAKALAKGIQVGDVVYLIGPLGAGKTFLARKLVKHLAGDERDVTSPTYSLVHNYEDTNVPITHIDLYRIKSAEEVVSLDLETQAQHSALLIEWPQQGSPYLIEATIKIEFELRQDSRQIQVQTLREVPGLQAQYTCG